VSCLISRLPLPLVKPSLAGTSWAIDSKFPPLVACSLRGPPVFRQARCAVHTFCKTATPFGFKTPISSARSGLFLPSSNDGSNSSQRSVRPPVAKRQVIRFLCDAPYLPFTSFFSLRFCQESGLSVTDPDDAASSLRILVFLEIH